MITLLLTVAFLIFFPFVAPTAKTDVGTTSRSAIDMVIDRKL